MAYGEEPTLKDSLIANEPRIDTLAVLNPETMAIVRKNLMHSGRSLFSSPDLSSNFLLYSGRIDPGEQNLDTREANLPGKAQVALQIIPGTLTLPTSIGDLKFQQVSETGVFLDMRRQDAMTFGIIH